MKTKLFLVLSLAAGAAGFNARSATAVDFAKDIHPILEKSCVQCHGSEKQKGKLRLDSREAALKGGSGGPSIVPGDAAKSEFYRRVTLPAGHDDIMPSEGDPLTKTQTDLIRDWINQGAAWTETGAAKPAAAAAPKNEPVLPGDFKPGAAEQAALARLSQAGIEARQIALNVPWREVNLRLQGANVTDATMAPLKDLHSLVEINLANTKITDAGLASLKDLPHLQKLHLELTGITDAGLAHLKGLTNLVYLNLYGTAVTDAGLDHLKGMRYLKNLYVWQTKVTDEGKAALQKALPEVSIVGGWEAAELAKNEKKDAEKKEEKK